MGSPSPHRDDTFAGLKGQHLLDRLLCVSHALAFHAELPQPELDTGVWSFSDLERAQRLLPVVADDISDFATALHEGIHSEDRTRRREYWNDALSQLTSAGSTIQFEYRCRDRDGEWHWLREEANLACTTSGFNAIGIVADISEQKRNSILHSGQTTILKMVAEHRPLSETLDALNRVIEALLPESRTCILRYSAPTNTVHHLSAPSLPFEYSQALDGTYVAPDKGSCGAALCYGEPVITPDILTDPRWEPFVALAVERYGLRSCWSHPILSNSDDPLGTFAIYHCYPYMPGQWERDTLATAAYLAGVAIERASAEAQIRWQARYDSLTHLPNRHTFTQECEERLGDSQRSQRSLALLFIDVDRFKQVNDSFGHSEGDRLLVALAERLREFLGNDVFRMGGDEFTILLDDTNLGDAVAVATALHGELTKPVALASCVYTPGVTFGISAFPGHASNATELLKHADIALHRAKEEGHAIRAFDPELARDVERRVHLERELRKAVLEDQFVLYYQPQVDPVTERVIRVEALIRWNHPERGLISPIEFIPLAEETGLILAIGEWVLRTACLQSRAWELAGLTVPISVNLSARQLSQPDLSLRIAQCLKATKARPELIGLELTETALLRHGPMVEITLRTLKELGVRIELDDFGTGYSSMVSLRSYPIDALKIDRQFIKNIDSQNSDAAIVRGLIDMSHALKMQVVAEGVETTTQASILRQMSCDILQGFLFARPIPASELTKLLKLRPIAKPVHLIAA